MLKQRVLTAIVMLLVLYAGTAWLSPVMFAGFLSLILLPALLEWGRLMGLVRDRERLVFVLCFTAILSLVIWFLLTPDTGSVQQTGLFLTSSLTLNVTGVVIISLLAVMFWTGVFYFLRRYPRRQEYWQARWRIGLMGLACLLPTWVGFLYLKVLAPSGLLVLILVAQVSVVDIGAYFAGRAWGNRKLAPDLSPKKTWAGFWGGVSSCAVLTLCLLAWVHTEYQALSALTWLLLLLAALLLAVFSVIGDLFESMLKRHRGIKDSGRSLPGHGGVLDRIDSLVAATPIYVLALALLSARLEVL
ncbi:phosphatidate cytidylyltransferase [Pseudohongiella sp.]|uniref:Phosphatidate cytidylyltransferase n=1 Tax=marine sediment metagenome TaxID=412755 RepID=A0A0F9W6F3_9ZZZZ|nr:phosphatidate cytidylyltransferase [Pseudohongiella sp.]HDZ08497.1 CDP-archaeol synthase [Pseudohongiella sp.]HEA61765.1 CDP-archaeol synthase [Pseudohongiella sp.]